MTSFNDDIVSPLPPPFLYKALFLHKNSSPGQNPGPSGCAATPRATILHRCCPRRIVASSMSRISGADHKRSATAAARGHTQGMLLVPSTYSLHIHASPPCVLCTMRGGRLKIRKTHRGYKHIHHAHMHMHYPPSHPLKHTGRPTQADPHQHSLTTPQSHTHDEYFMIMVTLKIKGLHLVIALPVPSPVLPPV